MDAWAIWQNLGKQIPKWRTQPGHIGAFGIYASFRVGFKTGS